MSSRVEKRKLLKKQKRIKVCKLFIIVFTLVILYYGIRVVNMNIVYLDYLKDPVIFRLNIKDRKIYLFGKSYLIDLKIFKKTY
ncbi:hypothetical protein [Clostridium sp. Cult2]|uniref:hypothetical protein n=1 Tax=Clostridium sp. Cult2 TaxID=2079003 RepID=UPI001F32F8CE|nr:hypothetical protein [Clostridium sp. Cult2]MCF6465603.1 hypothetical protein [Clostridium sp. Cult2]